MQFVDTNIFIRFLTRDDEEKADACLLLLKKARSGEVKLQTTESVITEIVYILSSKKLYKLSRLDILEKVALILKIRGLTIPHKRILLRALDVYSQTALDFEDAVLIAHMQRTKSRELFSYDAGFDKIPSVRRLEPLNISK